MPMVATVPALVFLLLVAIVFFYVHKKWLMDKGQGKTVTFLSKTVKVCVSN